MATSLSDSEDETFKGYLRHNAQDYSPKPPELDTIARELMKQIEHVEREIDPKIVAFGKLGVNTGLHHATADSVPLLDEEHVFENMASELETLLTKLVSLNDKMTEIEPNGPIMFHRMQKHKETLIDYKLEFKKILKNFRVRKNREDLLGSKHDNFKGVSGSNRRDMYLKESQHLNTSDRLINDQISIAMDTKEHLISQRQAFKRIQTRFNDISNRFPAVNSVIQRIKLRKRRDSLILGGIIGFCTFLMLLYAFH